MRLAAAVLAVLLVYAVPPALARVSLHPPVRLLDAEGESVVVSGGPVSPMASCGGCHDTDYIALESCHSWVGFHEACKPGAAVSGRAWDTGTGLYGRWDPLSYSMPLADGAHFTRGVADWVREEGWRHVGGGAAEYAPSGARLTDVEASAEVTAATHALDPATGQPAPWDWRVSGIVELNCFVCHMRRPDNAARVAELSAGRFRWAATATLASTGLVSREDGSWGYNAEAIGPDGTVDAAALRLADPTALNCGLCHAPVYYGAEPLSVVPEARLRDLETVGQVFSPQRPSQSALNLAGKGSLNEPWDVHAERLLDCVSCHYSLNSPAYFGTEPRAGLDHLRFDARVLEISDYLRRPSHQFAKGYSASITLADHLDGSVRRCEDCHEPEAAHDWLPYKRRHFAALLCEACHVPAVHAPARMMTDWTLLTAAGEPQVVYRGVDGPVDDPATLIEGYRPVLLLRRTPDGERRLGPHNVIASWYWVAGEPPRPVALDTLRQALYDGEALHPDVVAALDDDGDGRLSDVELRLETEAKAEAVAARLRAAGVKQPHIAGELQPYSLHHNVVAGPEATRDCAVCHSGASRVTGAFALARYLPAGVEPQLVGDTNVSLDGPLAATAGGGLSYTPRELAQGIYLLGHSRWPWADYLGLALFALVTLVAGGHAIARAVASRRRGSGVRT